MSGGIAGKTDILAAIALVGLPLLFGTGCGNTESREDAGIRPGRYLSGTLRLDITRDTLAWMTLSRDYLCATSAFKGRWRIREGSPVPGGRMGPFLGGWRLPDGRNALAACARRLVLGVDRGLPSLP